MDKIIKINEEEYEVKYIYDLLGNLVRNGDLIELRKGEFFWTKKHFVRKILGLSKIVSFPNKIKMYLIAFRMQFTDLYSLWMKSKYISQ